MNADGVEEFLSQKFSQLLSTINSVHKNDHLIEGQGIKKMGQLFKLFVLIYIFMMILISKKLLIFIEL